MPTTTSLVGATTLPVPAGALNAHLSDPLVTGLLDFLGFALKDALDAKLAQMQGTSADACPTANRYDYDPGSVWVRNPVPALYVWWSGQSATVRETLLYSRRERTLGVMWVFDEIQYQDGAMARAGLCSIAAAAMERALDRGYHPAYGYGAAVAGTPLAYSLGPIGTIAFESAGMAAGQLAPVPVSDPRPGGGGEGARVNFYPAVQGKIAVSERFGGFIPSDPDDVYGEARVDISTNENGDPTSVLPYLSGVMPGWDGED